MTYQSFLICAILSLTSCSKNETAPVLEIRNGLKYEINQFEPFSGKHITYYENGTKKTETSYKDGKENGVITSWYQSGQKAVEENYLYGKKTGIRSEWYENGRKKSEQTYKHDKRDGSTIVWDENGTIIRNETYKNGLLAKKTGLKYGLYQ